MSKSFVPRAYQRVISDYILDHPRCAIFADMGLGKTAATLQAISILNAVDYTPTLIIGPLRVARSVWSDEIEKWADFSHLTYSRLIGTPAERDDALNRKADIYLINYENIPWLVEKLGNKWPFKTVVADESSKLKGLRARQGSKRARYLAQVAHKRVKRFVQLTGTPCSNGVIDLFSCGWFIDGGIRLGKTFTAFSQRWFRPDWSGYNLIPLPHAQKEIESLLSDVCLSLKASDYFDLKEPIVSRIEVDLPTNARTLYKTMETELFVKLKNHEVEAFNAASMTIKVQQIANGSLYVDDGKSYEEVHNAKIEALESIIGETNGAPVLVAYTFKSDLSRLQKAFPTGRVLDNNPKTLKDWGDRKISILFAHPASAGHGLNLARGGNILVFFSVGWSLETHLQILERLGPTRQKQEGMDRPVFVYYITAKGTIDEQILERLKTKRSVQDVLLEAMKAKS